MSTQTPDPTPSAGASEAQTPKPGPLRSSALIAVALVAFLATTAGMRALAPWPDDYGMRTKIAYFDEHKDEYDVLFVGSSITFHGIVPEVFDQVMAERGRPTRTLNMGIAAMVSLEGDHLLRHLLDERPKQLRYVFIEAENWDPRIWDARNAVTDRSIHWHDALHTRYALESLSHMPERRTKDGAPFWKREPWWRIDEGWIHLRLAGHKLVSGGMGRRMLSHLPGVEAVPEEEVFITFEELDATRGYIDPAGLRPDHPEAQRWVDRAAKFQTELGQYIAVAKKLDAANAGRPPLSNHFNLDGLREQVQAVRDAGAEPIFYTGPRAAAMPIMYSLADAGVFPSYFGFNLPRKYEVLYRPNVHIDNNHLNREGAETWTRIFANEFADRLDKAAAAGEQPGDGK